MKQRIFLSEIDPNKEWYEYTFPICPICKQSRLEPWVFRSIPGLKPCATCGAVYTFEIKKNKIYLKLFLDKPIYKSKNKN